MASEPLVFNGINGATGEYLLPPMTAEEFYQRAMVAAGAPRLPDDEEQRDLLQAKKQQAEQHLAPAAGIDVKRLEEAGWGVIFAHDADPALKEALQPLLDLRREQASQVQERRFRVFEGHEGYRPGRDGAARSATTWLADRGVGPGPANPRRGLPYYLLLVGSPEQIPYTFQYGLDVQYAVGRLHFDTLDEYHQYARSVVVAERGAVALPRQATFFGTRNPDDRATRCSVTDLVQPLARTLSEDVTSWQFQTVLGEEATKARLARLLGGEETPALLFTATHGMGFPAGDPRQLPHQGALICQDWPGPEQWGRRPIPPEFYFAGDDVAADARLLGLLAFFFACFGAGTPRHDDFPEVGGGTERARIAPEAFLARLPRQLLGHPRGGALAVVGHVERAWTYSFQWHDAGPQQEVFCSALIQLAQGYPVGAAMEFFNQRYAELSSILTRELDDLRFGKRPEPWTLAGYWTANNDARGYAIVGDPAVRLCVAPPGSPGRERPAFEPAMS